MVAIRSKLIRTGSGAAGLTDNRTASGPIGRTVGGWGTGLGTAIGIATATATGIATGTGCRVPSIPAIPANRESGGRTPALGHAAPPTTAPSAAAASSGLPP
jgi:hypothetical protein